MKREHRRIGGTIRTLTQQIVRAYKPQSVILFGSHAWGRPSPESDIDLLVIKKTKKPRSVRSSDLRLRLFPTTMPLDILIYTPKELEKKITVEKNLFLNDVVTNGITLYGRHQVRD